MKIPQFKTASLKTFLALAALMALVGCPKDAPVPPVPPTPITPTSWGAFQNELASGGFRLTTIGRGDLRPGSLVVVSTAGVASGTPWLQLSDCVSSRKVQGLLPGATTQPGVVGNYTAGEAGGVSFSAKDLTELFGVEGGAESIRAGSFTLNKVQWRTALEGAYAAWIAKYKDHFDPVCSEGPKVKDVHLVTGLFEADFETSTLDFSSRTVGGMADLKRLLTLHARAYKVRLSSSGLRTDGNLVPLAAQTVPLSDLMDLPEDPPPFELEKDEKAMLSQIVGGMTGAELWNSAFGVSLSASFLLEPGTITAIVEVQGQLLRGMGNPGRVSTGQWGKQGVSSSRIYVDGELKTPVPRVIAPGVESAELEVGPKFELVTVREFPYKGCVTGQDWERLAVPITFRNFKYVQVQVFSAEPPPKNAELCSVRGDEHWKVHALKVERNPVKMSDITRLRQLLETKRETELVAKLGKVLQAARKRSPGWVLKPKSIKLSDIVLMAFSCP